MRIPQASLYYLSFCSLSKAPQKATNRTKSFEIRSANKTKAKEWNPPEPRDLHLFYLLSDATLPLLIK